MCFGFLFELSTICLNASNTLFPVLSFKGILQAYLVNTSITLIIYLNPLLSLLHSCISTKSQLQISSIAFVITWRRWNFLLTDLCNSSANSSFHDASSSFLKHQTQILPLFPLFLI